MTNWEAYFGTPERAAITLCDFVYHSQMCSMSDEGIVPTFDVTAECTMPPLNISKIAPGASISEWLESEVRDD